MKGGGASREDSEGFLNRFRIKTNRKGGGASREDFEGFLIRFAIKTNQRIQENEEESLDNSNISSN